MNNIIDRADLACKSGSKDAVYHLQIVEMEGGFVVNYQNGRAGGTLAGGSKSPKGPGTLELARKTFDKVVKEKMTASPPYQPMLGRFPAHATERGNEGAVHRAVAAVAERLAGHDESGGIDAGPEFRSPAKV